VKHLKIATVTICWILLVAATKGTEVTAAQINQFQIGNATILDVEGKLGMPQRSGPGANGGTALDYILMDESANAAASIPVARLVAGAMNLHETRVEFQFDTSGHLVGVQTSQRDLVCPHKVCGVDRLSQPWVSVQTQGDGDAPTDPVSLGHGCATRL
jgi:hypothetical protein